MTIKEKEKKIKEFERNIDLLSYAIYNRKEVKNGIKKVNNKNNRDKYNISNNSNNNDDNRIQGTQEN